MFAKLLLLLAGFLGNEEPYTYECARAHEEMPRYTNQSFWEGCKPIPYFVDLGTGQISASPTQAMMLWDDDYLYLKVEMDDEKLWAAQAEDESKVYLDNAFELFVDPDGDGLSYVEYEINALGTTWDLLMDKPYRDGGKPLSEYDMKNVRHHIVLNGTLNDPTDEDEGWTLFMAIPFYNFEGLCLKPKPTAGDVWRVNLVRVCWHLQVVDGTYYKVKHPITGKHVHSYNVWTSHGTVNMHMPERFGYLVFK